MLVQSLAAALIVAACSLYAAWSLMPGTARRRIARALLAYGPPETVARALRKHAAPASGCTCDGCDRGSAKPAPATVQPIRFQPRPRR